MTARADQVVVQQWFSGRDAHARERIGVCSSRSAGTRPR